MELIQGARDKAEMKNIKSFLIDFGFNIIPLSQEIGHRASIFMEEYALSAGLCIDDALIASTAVENNLTLITGNEKHFSPIKELIKVFYP
jgi:predicted nucleic acid-binding protein